MPILTLTLSKKLKKAMEGLSETRAAFQGLTDSLSQIKFRTGRGRRNRPRDTEGCSQIYEVQQEKVLESLYWDS